MSDQRKPSEPRRTAAEREDSPGPDPAPLASAATLKAVSDLLASKQDVWARSSTPPIPFADLVKPLGDLSRKLEHPSDCRTSVFPPRTSLESPPVKLPDDPTDRPKNEEPVVGDSFTPESRAGTSSARGVLELDAMNSKRESIHSPGQNEPVSESSRGLQAPSDGDHSASRLSVSITHSVDPVRAIDSIRSGERFTDSAAGMPGGTPALSQAHRDDDKETQSNRTVEVPGISSVDRLRESSNPGIAEDPRQPVEPAAPESPGSGTMVGAQSVTRTNRSVSSVRNPLSADLRNFTMANHDRSEPLETGVGIEGLGSTASEAGDGFASSESAGGSVDLSKTNELLQQLVDAVRKQRGAGLPVGGPPVYPDR